MTEDRLRYLGSSEIITEKLDQIIEAFVGFYGEDRRSEIEEKLRSVLILRFTSTQTLGINITQVKESILREVYNMPDDNSLLSINFLINFLTKADTFSYGYMPDEIRQKIFGEVSAVEALKIFNAGGYPKLNEFLEKYEKIRPILEPYEKMIEREDAKKGKIREKYYKKLVDEFSYVIPKQELDEYQLIGFPRPIMQSYFGWDVFDNGHCFDTESDNLLADENCPDYKRDSIIHDRLGFLKENGYEFMTYEGALSDPKCLEFIARAKEICSKISKRKSELYNEQTREIVESLEDYQKCRKEIQTRNFVNKDDSLGPFVYESLGVSCYEPNYVFDGEKFVLSPIVLINAGATEPDCTIIHELNHAFEFHTIDVDQNGCTNVCGWEYDSIEFKQQQGSQKIYSGISRDHELLSEYINDRIAQEITDIMHEQGHYILKKDRGYNTSCYMTVGFLAEKFYQEFKDIIIKSRSNGNFEYIYEQLGKENFEAFNNLTNEVYNKYGFGIGACVARNDYYEGKQTEGALIIKDFIERRDVIINEMKNYLQNVKTTSGMSR